MYNVKTIIANIRWKSLQVVYQLFAGLIGYYVLLQYLKPEDFGIMAIASSVVGFLIIIADLGLNNPIIQENKLTKTKTNTLNTLYIVSGFLGALLLYSSSSFLSMFFEIDILEPIFKALSISLFLDFCTGIVEPLIHRSFDFKKLSIYYLSKDTIGWVVVILLAIYGFGIYSLVIAHIIRSSVLSLLFFIHSIKYFNLGLEFNVNSVKPLLKNGMLQLSESLLNNLSKDADTLIIAKLLGPNLLGIYTVFKQLLIKPYQNVNNIINTIYFPLLSKFGQKKELVVKLFKNQLSSIYFVTIPVYSFVLCAGSIIVRNYFGDSYLPFLNVFYFLGLYYMLRSINNPAGVITISQGKYLRSLYWNVIITILNIVLIYILAIEGLNSVAIGLSIFQGLLVLGSYTFLVKYSIPISTTDYLLKILKPILISCFCLPLCLLIVKANIDDLLQLIIAIFIFGGSYLFLLYYFQRESLKMILSVLKSPVKSS